MREDAFEEPSNVSEKCELPIVLDTLIDAAIEKGIIAGTSIIERDLFDTKLMGVLIDRPSHIEEVFQLKYARNPQSATDWYYDFSQASNYIRRDRIAKDKKWTVMSDYGTLDITINLSKPEKDPKVIAACKEMPQTAYPKCQLCMENEGYAGRLDHPARQNHRIIPLIINGQHWGFQYSPYVYYNEHCIVFNGQHVPMKIDRTTFEKLFSFVEQFPHYFLGSNADLPIVGGSILSHDHFQGGHYEFAMERAKIDRKVVVLGYEDIEAYILHWPLSVIRICSDDYIKLIDMGEHILNKWKKYSDQDAFIFSETNGEPHNTITPIARKRDKVYELDLVLRNNITSDEHPLGVYHPHEQYHHIKKENIGLIEVMGLAVLPSRLDHEMKLLMKCLVDSLPFDTYEELKKHSNWAEMIRCKYKVFDEDTVESIVQHEIGNVFIKVLEDAGVFKQTKDGQKAFDRFISSL